MKRDMDLVRKILLAMEAHEAGFAPQNFSVEGYSAEHIGYHAYLMDEAGLIEAVDITHCGSPSKTAIPRSITWHGYEFLEAARNDTIWEKALATARDRALPLMFDVLKELALSLARSAVA